jgi:hypothetical protein
MCSPVRMTSLVAGRCGALRAFVCAALFGLVGPAWAQFTASGTVTATAQVVRTLAVTSVTDLSFGTFAPGRVPGAVTMSATGARSAVGGVTLVSSSGGSASTVNLSGTPSTAYTVAFPRSVALTSATGPETMMLWAFTTSLTGSQGSLDSAGNGSFGVGGTLVVAANQPVAVYSGSFTVTLTYN